MSATKNSSGIHINFEFSVIFTVIGKLDVEKEGNNCNNPLSLQFVQMLLI